MGLSAKDGLNGPGSYDFTIDRIYQNNPGNPNAMKAETMSLIFLRIKEMFGNPADSLRYLEEKLRWEWMNPTFAVLEDSIYPIPAEGSSEFRALMVSSGVKGMYYFLEVFTITVYLTVFASALRFANLLKAKRNSAIILVVLYFIGGFTYQILFEQKARYCLPYFLILMVIMVINIDGVVHKEG